MAPLSLCGSGLSLFSKSQEWLCCIMFLATAPNQRHMWLVPQPDYQDVLLQQSACIKNHLTSSRNCLETYCCRKLLKTQACSKSCILVYFLNCDFAQCRFPLHGGARGQSRLGAVWRHHARGNQPGHQRCSPSLF